MLPNAYCRPRAVTRLHRSQAVKQSLEHTAIPDEIMVSTGKAFEPTGLRPDVALALTKLGRLGLIDSAAAFGGMATVHWVSMTELGRPFVATCRPQ